MFSDSVSWRLLVFFFSNPDKSFFVKEISRKASVSAGSVSRLCRKLFNQNFLLKSLKGNSVFYSLNNPNPVVRRLKSAWFLNKLMVFKNVFEFDEFFSVALYGSFASGDFVSKSDIDLLVITSVPESKVFKLFRGIRNNFKEELSLTVLSLSDWRELAKKNSRFYVEVLSNHFVIFGESLVVG